MNKPIHRAEFEPKVEILPPLRSEGLLRVLIVQRPDDEMERTYRGIDTLLFFLAVPLAVGIGAIAAGLVAHLIQLVQ